MLDAEDTLDQLLVNGMPDAERFTQLMVPMIERACGGRRCLVRIYGQMVDVLWKNNMRDAAIRLELLWNQLAMTQTFSLLCGYALGHFYYDANVADICSQHTHVVAADGKTEAVA
jgi:DcmR-like sensory protein